MLTSKQRSNLRSMASTMKPVAQVGKEGISETLLVTLSEALEKRELIKINLLPTAADDLDNLAENLAELVHAELVTVIGRKAILYRRSTRENFEHLKF